MASNGKFQGREVVIVEALRTPIGRGHEEKGYYKDVHASNLLSTTFKELVDRGVYALHNGQSGQIVFQLHGNGYRFGQGHRVALQLLGRDAPYYQNSNGTFSVRVQNLSVRLPRLAK